MKSLGPSALTAMKVALASMKLSAAPARQPAPGTAGVSQRQTENPPPSGLQASPLSQHEAGTEAEISGASEKILVFRMARLKSNLMTRDINHHEPRRQVVPPWGIDGPCSPLHTFSSDPVPRLFFAHPVATPQPFREASTSRARGSIPNPLLKLLNQDPRPTCSSLPAVPCAACCAYLFVEKSWPPTASSR